MEEKVRRKIVTATIKKSEIDGKLVNANPPAELNEKLKLAKALLEIPSNFQDDFDIQYSETEIIFKWQLSSIDSNAELLHKKAIILARQGTLDKAIENWSEATIINPLDPDYFFNLGVAYFEQKKFIDAIENLSRVLAICPFYYKAYLILGTAYLKIRKFEFAQKYLHKSILYDKSNPLSFLNLGAVDSILKLYDEAIKMFEKAIQISPKEARAYLGLAKIYSTLGKIEQANDYFKKVIELDTKGNLANYAKRSIISLNKRPLESDIEENVTGNPEDYYSEGYRYYIGGNYSKSASMYKKYLAIKPDDDYIWYALGEVQLRLGKPDLALEAFKKAIKIYPKKGLYFKELTIAFDKLNKPEKVIAAATKAKQLGKSDSVLYCLWGKALYQIENYDDAVVILEKSLELNRNNLLAKYLLAETLIKINENDDAIDYLHELKDSKIDTTYREKANKLYDKLTFRG